LWPNAQEDITRVAGHVIAWISGPGPLVDAHLHLTRIVVAANRATNALGVYWGAASHVIRADLFDDLAHRTGGLPVTLWVDFRCYVVDGRSSLFTVGLAAFGVMELEIANSVRRVGELREFAAGLAEYLIRNGPVIEEGHTVGGSENERVVVRHAPSMVDRPGMVYRLDGF
jgi:hypothetical protein